MYVTPTEVLFTDPAAAPEPGWAIGASLIGSSGERFPVYYIFPMTTELATLQSLRGAVLGARRRAGPRADPRRLPGHVPGGAAGPPREHDQP